MPSAKFSNSIVHLGGILGSWIRLDDRSVHLAFIHSPNHLFFSADESKNTTLTQMRVRIDHFVLHSSSLIVHRRPAKKRRAESQQQFPPRSA
jgi:hypothetical protein